MISLIIDISSLFFIYTGTPSIIRVFSPNSLNLNPILFTYGNNVIKISYSSAESSRVFGNNAVWDSAVESCRPLIAES